MARGDQTVLRVRGATRDRNGDPIDDGSTVAFKSCIVYPRGTPEETDDATRDTTVITMTIYVPPPNVDVHSDDSIRWGGHDWEIDGEPAAYHKSSDKGTFIYVKRARG